MQVREREEEVRRRGEYKGSEIISLSDGIEHGIEALNEAGTGQERENKRGMGRDVA